MTWVTVGGGETNPYTTVIPDADYTASNEDMVISEGYAVELPTPEANAIVGISAIGSVEVSTPSGTIENVGDLSVLNDSETGYFVSDGTNWFLITPRDGLGFGDQ